MWISGVFLVIITLCCGRSSCSPFSTSHERKRTTPVARLTSWNTHGYHAPNEREVEASREGLGREGEKMTTALKGTRTEKRRHSSKDILVFSKHKVTQLMKKVSSKSQEHQSGKNDK